MFCISYIYIFYSYFQPLLHMNRKAFHLQSMRQKSSAKKPAIRAAQVGFFCCHCVCVCVCRYTQRILTVDLSHVEIWLEVLLEIKTLTKKKLKQQNNLKKQPKKTPQTAEFCLIRTTVAHVSPGHTGRGTFAGCLISCCFFFLKCVCVCDSYGVLTSAVSWYHLAVWVVLTH